MHPTPKRIIRIAIIPLNKSVTKHTTTETTRSYSILKVNEFCLRGAIRSRKDDFIAVASLREIPRNEDHPGTLYYIGWL